MNRAIGIDADRRRIAAALVFGESRLVWTIQRMGATGLIEPKYTQGLRRLMRLAKNLNCPVALEGIFYKPGNPRMDEDAFRVCANVQGEIAYEAHNSGLRINIVMPYEWQAAMIRRVTRRGALKAGSMRIAQKELGGNCTEHEADAMCLAIYQASVSARMR